MNSIDLKIVFSEDAKEWDKYLTDCLTEAIESASYQLQIVHERIENFQLSRFVEDEVEQLTKASSATLIILSPDFLAYVAKNDDLRNYFKQFKPDRTLSMLCGVKESELTAKIRENLVQYDTWKCLIAKEQDNEFIFSVIDQIRTILQRNNPLDEIYSPYSFVSLRTKRPIPNYANEYKNLDSIKVSDEDRKERPKKIKPKFCKFKLTPNTVKRVSFFEFLRVLESTLINWLAKGQKCLECFLSTKETNFCTDLFRQKFPPNSFFSE